MLPWKQVRRVAQGISTIPPDIMINAKSTRPNPIHTLLPKMRVNYVFPDMAEKKMAAAVLTRENTNSSPADSQLSNVLTQHLQEVSHDKLYIRVMQRRMRCRKISLKDAKRRQTQLTRQAKELEQTARTILASKI